MREWQYWQPSPLSHFEGSPHSSPCFTLGQGVDLHSQSNILNQRASLWFFIRFKSAAKLTYICTSWGSVFDLDCCGSEGRRSPVCIVLGVLYTGLFYNWLKQNLYLEGEKDEKCKNLHLKSEKSVDVEVPHLAIVGLLSEFSQS